jgi:GAF domain-containing protein
MAYPESVWQSLADLSSLLLSEESLDTNLRRVADLAVRTIEKCDAVGVTLIDDHQLSTHAATGGLVYEVDNYQYDIGEGPCAQAVQDMQPFEIPVMSEDDRWPRFSRHAAERGINSSLSLPLMVRGTARGALNLYSRTARAFSDSSRSTAMLFAAQAAVALANRQTYEASVRLAEELREALRSRAVIEQAKGVIRARDKCTDDEAFELLRVTSQHANRKLHDIACDLVEEASRPDRTVHTTAQ